MKLPKPKPTTIAICAALFIFFLILVFPYRALRGPIFSKIQKSTGLMISSEDLSLALFGWPGIKLRKVDLIYPIQIGYSPIDLELSAEKASVRLGLFGFFPPFPAGAISISGLRKGGDLYVRVGKLGSRMKALIETEDVALDQFNLGMAEPLTGKLTLDAVLEYFGQDLSKTTGRFVLDIKQFRVPAQNLQIMILPAIPFGDVTAELQVRNGTVEVTKFQFGSANSDVRGNAIGELRLGNTFMNSFLNFTLRIQLSDKYRLDPQTQNLVSFLNAFQMEKPGEYAMKWGATFAEMSSNALAAIPQKATR